MLRFENVGKRKMLMLLTIMRFVQYQSSAPSPSGVLWVRQQAAIRIQIQETQNTLELYFMGTLSSHDQTNKHLYKSCILFKTIASVSDSYITVSHVALP